MPETKTEEMKMKKILAILCALCMVFALCACGQSAVPAATAAPAASAEPSAEAAPAAETEPAADAQSFTVGICQLLQHEALDRASQGFTDTLKEKLGDQVDINWQNGSGDQSSCSVIANQFVSDEVDLILANATPALAASAAATNEIPVLGTSITSYAAVWELDNWDARSTQLNVSGTSDLAPLDEQAAMLNSFFPDAKTVGILYCSAEANSKFQVEAITPFLENYGYTVTAYSFSDSNDVASVTSTAVGECEVLYIPTDNTAASCAETINNIALPAGVPIIAGESGLCKGCGIATLSIDYYALGCTTGEMAYEILVNGADPATMEIEYAPEFTKMYNAELCEALNITVPDDYIAIE